MRNAGRGSSSGRYVLDSFAVLALLFGEGGAGEVKEVLREAQGGKALVFLHWNNLAEVYHIVRRASSRRKALEAVALVKALPVQLVEFEEALWLEAAELKATFPISYADAFAAATACVKGAELVTGDPEFEALKGRVQIRWLSRKEG